MKIRRFRPESLKTEYWTMTESPSRTKIPPMIGRSISVLVRIAAAARTPPIASEPVSPKKGDGRVGQKRYTSRPRREPVQAVGEVHGVGRADDDQEHEEAEERDPDPPGPEHEVLVEAGKDDILCDADIVQRHDVRKENRQRQPQ